MFLFLVVFVGEIKAATLEVGSGKAHSTIQSAVNAASSGDTVNVHSGTYNEKVDLNKSLTLQGNGTVWIDGGCNLDYGVQITAANSTVKNIGVKKVKSQGIIIRKGTTANVTIEGNTIQDFNCQDAGEQYAAGVASWYGGPNTKVINNTIKRRVEIAGNPNGKGNGIWFKSSDTEPNGGGHTISGNNIVGGYDGIGGETESSVRGSFDKNSTIENNTVRNCWDDGIQSEGGNVNITIKNNRIEKCGVGIAFAPNKIGPLYIQNNTIISDESARGVHGQLSCYKLGRVGSGTTYLTSNDCRIGGTSNGGNGYSQNNSGLSPIVSRNNVMVVSRYVMEFKDVPPAGSSFDNDCMYTSDPGRFIKWGGTRYSDLSSFKSGTGNEQNGTYNQNCPATGVGGAVVVPPSIPNNSQPTTAPGASASSKPTAKATSKPTEKPKVTEKPNVTEKPKVSEKPKTTEKPKSENPTENTDRKDTNTSFTDQNSEIEIKVAEDNQKSENNKRSIPVISGIIEGVQLVNKNIESLFFLIFKNR